MEKKSDTATNEKVSTKYIPDDISFSILSKLPLKSFKRFECVRKSWSLLFENQQFMNMFRNNLLFNSHCDEACSLILKIPSVINSTETQLLYSLSGDSFESKIQLNFSNPFEYEDDFQIFGFGSINGILLLHQCCKNEHILWNPTTNQFGLIPRSPVDSYVPDVVKVSRNVVSYLHGFGYDCTADDYKVIHYVFFPDKNNRHGKYVGNQYFDPLWEIYSARSNSWRKLNVDMPPSLKSTKGMHLYMDGVCHWLCKKRYGSSEKHNSPFQPCLVSFYLSNDVFLVTPIPSDEDDCFKLKASWINLAVLNESISLISYFEETVNFHVSVLGELGIKESWTKLFIVGPMPDVERPIGVGRKGEIFYIRKDDQLAWLDLTTLMIKQLGFKVDMLDCRIIIYTKTGSLF